MFFRMTCIALFMIAVGLAGSGVPAAIAAEKTCVECHKKVIAKRVVHSAVSQYARMEQGCETCHTASHAKKKGELSLAAKVPELCYMSHDQGKFTK
jgi:predicted CXXCH cytochrome family protein